jgi:hypothetical protein
MAAIESISFKNNSGNSSASGGLTLELYPLRFRFAATRPLHFGPGQSANMLRGQFGKALFQQAPSAYDRLFAPSSREGPSGLRDLPRPFVMRVAHLDGLRLAPGERFDVGMNLFDIRAPAIETIRDAVCAAVRARFVGTDGFQVMRLSLAALDTPVHRVRVRFVTPTELKGAESPEFSVLFSRIRDRVSTLRALYGQGSLVIDFKGMGRRSELVHMTRCDLEHLDAERVSRRTGQRHSLGGFIGMAEYEGDLAEFVPYLEAAQWTGVGRQTVWGKGEIAWEEI